jgi:hypothetical protein
MKTFLNNCYKNTDFSANSNPRVLSNPLDSFSYFKGDYFDVINAKSLVNWKID